jgi:hypothetical protein
VYPVLPKALFIKLLTYGGKQFVKQLALAQRLAEAYESGLAGAGGRLF